MRKNFSPLLRYFFFYFKQINGNDESKKDKCKLDAKIRKIKYKSKNIQLIFDCIKDSHMVDVMSDKMACEKKNSLYTFLIS